MSRVPIVRLSEVLTLQCDEVATNPLAAYGMAGIRSYGHGLFAKATISGAESSYAKLFRLHTGQVVLSRLFAWEGAVAVVQPEFDGWFVSPEFPSFEVNQECVLTSYLQLFASWSGFHEKLAGSTRGLGQRRKRVHVEDFLQLTIPLPALRDQKAMSDRLEQYRDVADGLRRLSTKASALERALVVSLSSRPDMDEQEKIHTGWVRKPLSELMAASPQQVIVESDERYRIAGIYSFGKGLIDRGSMSGSDTVYKTFTVLDEGDVVVSKLNGWEGAVAVVDKRFAGCCVSSEYPVYKVDRSQLRSDFFSAVARSPWFWEALNVNTRGSMVRRRRINSAQFLATELWLPSLDEQGRVASLLATVDDAMVSRSRSGALATAFMPSALNEAFAHVS